MSTNIEKKQYTSDFYKGQKKGSYDSAKKILKIVFDELKPQSMIDVGCGVGLWIKVANEDLKIEDVKGVEGDYILDKDFEIDTKLVQRHDLKQELNLGRQFDLVSSMEVGEHLPKENAANYVRTLTNHGKYILFSAAIIGQEGTYHINEQAPEYWAKLFKAHNYIPIDFIRTMIWNDAEIMPWYRQNALLYVHQDELPKLSEKLRIAQQNTNPDYLFRVHPDYYYWILKRKNLFQYAQYSLYRIKKFFREGQF